MPAAALPPSAVVLVAILAWGAVIAFIRFAVMPWLDRAPGGGPVNGLLWYVCRTYVRLVHRSTWTGADVLPDRATAERGLIVVANHTGAVDPLLIQAHCPFLIRWMMASDMMGPALDWLWRTQRMIAVERDGRDSASLREAIRHVRDGGILGIFPEGRITMPPREIRPFLPGVGLLIARTKAPVLLAWVSGTPETNQMMESLTTPSRSRVEFLELIPAEIVAAAGGPADIAEMLRRKIADASGWPLNDEVLPPGGAPA